ncbi:MAG: hypothetical protein ACOCRO_05820, partial [Halanaerobiales bacterium]
MINLFIFNSVSLISSFIDPLIDEMFNLVTRMNIIIGQGIYGILMLLMGILDIVQALFRVLAGIGTYSFRGDSSVYEGDMVIGFITDETFINIFIAMFAVGTVLLFVATFISVIKSEFEPLRDAKKENLSKGRIIGNSLRAIFNMVSVPIITIFGILLANSLLATIDLATAPSQAEMLSGRLFTVSAHEGNRYRNDENFRDLINPAEEEEAYAHFGIFTEEENLGGYSDIADMIDYAFANSVEVPDEGGAPNGENTDAYSFDKLVEVYGTVGDFSLYTDADSRIEGIAASDTGFLEKDLEEDHFSVYNHSMVFLYYDTSLTGGFSFVLLAILVAI